MISRLVIYSIIVERIIVERIIIESIAIKGIVVHTIYHSQLTNSLFNLYLPFMSAQF